MFCFVLFAWGRKRSVFTREHHVISMTFPCKMRNGILGLEDSRTVRGFLTWLYLSQWKWCNDFIEVGKYCTYWNFWNLLGWSGFFHSFFTQHSALLTRYRTLNVYVRNLSHKLILGNSKFHYRSFCTPEHSLSCTQLLRAHQQTLCLSSFQMQQNIIGTGKRSIKYSIVFYTKWSAWEVDTYQ